MITLPELPYAKDALEPHISKETLHYHYDKHHKAYVENLNKLIKDTEYADMSLEEIIKKSGSGPIFNNAAQVANHTFYWNSMTPTFEKSDDMKVIQLISGSFKSYAGFEKEFFEKGKKLFGSGWIWLTIDGQRMQIEATKNAGQPKHKPLIVCDVWEHAYYLDYKNERPKYLDNFLQVINWKFAEGNL